MNTRIIERVWRSVALAISSTAALYALVLGFAEPVRSLAASASQVVPVTLNVAADISISCTPTTVTLGTITRTGDSSVNVCGSAGYCTSTDTTCTVQTNNTAGYTLSWLVATGTGAAGSRTGTGWLNGFASTSNRIAPLGTGSTTQTGQPIAMAAGAGTVNNAARWAGRISSTSDDSVENGGSKSWGTDGVSDTWLRVATGSSVTVAGRAAQTDADGDIINVGFRAIIHGTAIVPTDIYKANVTLTALEN